MLAAKDHLFCAVRLYGSPSNSHRLYAALQHLMGLLQGLINRADQDADLQAADSKLFMRHAQAQHKPC